MSFKFESPAAAYIIIKSLGFVSMHADNETMCNKRLSSERPTSTDNVRH